MQPPDDRPHALEYAPVSSQELRRPFRDRCAAACLGAFYLVLALPFVALAARGIVEAFRDPFAFPLQGLIALALLCGLATAMLAAAAWLLRRAIRPA